MYKNELTYMQKAAIEGEIAYLISTADHDSDILLRLYCILSESTEEVRNVVLDCFKTLTHFPEEVYIKLLGDLSVKELPMWLWEDRVIEDMKHAIRCGESPDSDSLIEKREVRKKIVTSAFLLFCKKLVGLSLRIPIHLCQRVLQDDKLDFLHSSCFALITDLTEAIELGFGSAEDSQEAKEHAFNMSFDARDLLSYRIEIEALERLNSMEEGKEDENFPFKIASEKGRVKDVPKELQDILNRLAQVRKDVAEKGKGRGRKRKNPFVVKKIFKDSKDIVTLKTFSSIQQAEEYLENIVTKCPELKDTCTFVIEDFNNQDVMYVFGDV